MAGAAARDPDEEYLGASGDQATGRHDSHRARRQAPASSSRRRRAGLRHRRGECRRIRPREHGQHELPAERVRSHRDDEERRDRPGRGLGPHGAGLSRRRSMRLVVLVLVFLAVLVSATPGGAADAPVGRSDAPVGQVTWAVHISLAPTWFDPAETPGIGTPFMILYALHDALVKPMPGNAMAPSLAESWSVSKDGFVYEFVLRHGVKFHNGDPVTAEDVKFSFERYRGAAAKLLREKVAAVEGVDPSRGRFRFKEPWPDFMTYYGSLTNGARWIVPQKYLAKVGDDGFKKAPVGAGPYRFVSFNPGVELVLEAYEPYRGKSPSGKRL